MSYKLAKKSGMSVYKIGFKTIHVTRGGKKSFEVVRELVYQEGATIKNVCVSQTECSDAIAT